MQVLRSLTLSIYILNLKTFNLCATTFSNITYLLWYCLICVYDAMASFLLFILMHLLNLSVLLLYYSLCSTGNVCPVRSIKARPISAHLISSHNVLSSCFIVSYPVSSHVFSSLPISKYFLISSHLTASHIKSPHLTLSYHISSHLFPFVFHVIFYLTILCYCILSYLISSLLISPCNYLI